MNDLRQFHSCATLYEPGPLGSFALVSYIPEPYRKLLDSLRPCIPGRQLPPLHITVLPPLHITVLPPRPLRLAIELACSEVADAAAGVSPFEAELSGFGHFAETDYLHLDIAEGSDRLSQLHERLNTGPLKHIEAHEFRPHLTLGGPIPQVELTAAHQRTAHRWRTSSFPRRVLIEELVCLWLAPNADNHEWIRHGSGLLNAPPDSPQPSGVAITTRLHTSKMLS